MMELTVHERNILRQPISRPDVRELLAGRLRLFEFKRWQVECPLR